MFCTAPQRKVSLVILDFAFARLAHRSSPYPQELQYDLKPSVVIITEQRRHTNLSWSVERRHDSQPFWILISPAKKSRAEGLSDGATEGGCEGSKSDLYKEIDNYYMHISSF